jgi:radical SAM-linked protein
MARQPPQRDVAPVVQRLRLRYAKRGRLRFSSHRDFQRALERALRRANVPMAFSAGFSPHPKISYANAAPTGAASEAEYVEIAIVEKRDPADIRQALDDALPPGLDIVEVVEARTPDFAQRLQASVWRMQFPGVSEAELTAAVEALLAAETVQVERMTKNGKRAVDARAALVGAQIQPVEAGCAILEVVARHTTPAVRPDDIVTAFGHVADLVPPEPPRFTRLAQGPLDAKTDLVGDPFAEDRSALPVAEQI